AAGPARRPTRVTPGRDAEGRRSAGGWWLPRRGLWAARWRGDTARRWALLVAAALALLGAGPARVARPATAAAQAVIGVVIGVLARAETLVAVAQHWLAVLVVGTATLVLSMAAGLLLGLRPGVTPLTGMLALTAGGASGLVAVSRELGGDDRVVAVVQYLRVVLVTVSMPVVAALLYGASGGAGPGPAGPSAPWYTGLALTAGCAAVGVPLARLAKVPAGALLGPM